MKKQELLYLHQLLAETTTHIDDEDDPIMERESYQKLDIAPVSIHRRLSDHETAVKVLGGEIEAHLTDASYEADHVRPEPEEPVHKESGTPDYMEAVDDAVAAVPYHDTLEEDAAEPYPVPGQSGD